MSNDTCHTNVFFCVWLFWGLFWSSNCVLLDREGTLTFGESRTAQNSRNGQKCDLQRWQQSLRNISGLWERLWVFWTPHMSSGETNQRQWRLHNIEKTHQDCCFVWINLFKKKLYYWPLLWSPPCIRLAILSTLPCEESKTFWFSPITLKLCSAPFYLALEKTLKCQPVQTETRRGRPRW